eukprot:m.37367 g.37367  ORF g.37367 m.37367 type:complete len:232 (-) comp9307_c0_seq2:1857-2552(-)
MATTAYSVEGQELGEFQKAQVMGEYPLTLTEKSTEAQLEEIKEMANTAIQTVKKDSKHRNLAYSRCHVTTAGIFIYEQEKEADTPTLKFGSPAKQIYCVVLGRKKRFSSNQFACIMHVEPGTKPRIPFPMKGVVLEFHNDRKHEALKFHEATESMMNSLLFSEMGTMNKTDGAGGAGDAASEGGSSNPGGYMDIPDSLLTGKKARASIDASNAADNDYLMVVVPRTSSQFE